jgi:hypothetical protein
MTLQPLLNSTALYCLGNTSSELIGSGATGVGDRERGGGARSRAVRRTRGLLIPNQTVDYEHFTESKLAQRDLL